MWRRDRRKGELKNEEENKDDIDFSYFNMFVSFTARYGICNTRD